MSKTITVITLSWHTLAALRIPEPTRSGLGGQLPLWILVYHRETLFHS